MRGLASASLSSVRVTCWPTIGSKFDSRQPSYTHQAPRGWGSQPGASRGLRVVNLDAQERREAGERLVGVRQATPEVRGKAEGEGGVEAAIVGEAKATDLVTTELPGPRRRQKERREREAELADLLVQIPQVRGLDVDRGPDLRGQGVGAKEPGLVVTGVGRGVERMTVATGKESGPVGLARRQRIEEGLGAKEDIKAQLLLRVNELSRLRIGFGGTSPPG